MEDLQALVILRSLANGVDPEAGQYLDPENPVQRPQTVRALERTERQDRKQSLAPSRAMAPWTTNEDRQLLERFDAGMSPRELGMVHQRSSNAVRVRLTKLGRLARVS